jgi:hypothetical protein
MSEAIVITGQGIQRFQMLSQYHAAKLEGLGLKHSSGKSVTAHIKRTYKLKGSRDKVLKEFREMIDKTCPIGG